MIIKDGGPAFPIGSGDVRDPMGMSLRDYFAGQALANMNITVQPPSPYRSVCIKCAESDEHGRPASCVCAQCREEREWAMADDFAAIARALDSARGWVPERTEDNLLSLIGEALSALDRLAGKLRGLV